MIQNPFLPLFPCKLNKRMFFSIKRRSPINPCPLPFFFFPQLLQSFFESHPLLCRPPQSRPQIPEFNLFFFSPPPFQNLVSQFLLFFNQSRSAPNVAISLAQNTSDIPLPTFNSSHFRDFLLRIGSPPTPASNFMQRYDTFSGAVFFSSQPLPAARAW